MEPIHVGQMGIGFFEACYLEEQPEFDEGPFLNEERLLIDAISDHTGKTGDLDQCAGQRQPGHFTDPVRPGPDFTRGNYSYTSLLLQHLNEIVFPFTRNLSPHTVSRHRENIRRKLGLAHEDINLVSFLKAYGDELITPPES
jgi:hypothetical protein